MRPPPENCGARMLDCNHFVIFNLCLYGNSLNQTPISPRLETITSLASALPGRPTVKTSITTQNSDAVRSTTEVLRTAFCLPSFRRGDCTARRTLPRGWLARRGVPLPPAGSAGAIFACPQAHHLQHSDKSTPQNCTHTAQQLYLRSGQEAQQ